jgi:hypothetical protein
MEFIWAAWREGLVGCGGRRKKWAKGNSRIALEFPHWNPIKKFGHSPLAVSYFNAID